MFNQSLRITVLGILNLISEFFSMNTLPDYFTSVYCVAPFLSYFASKFVFVASLIVWFHFIFCFIGITLDFRFLNAPETFSSKSFFTFLLMSLDALTMAKSWYRSVR